MSICSDGAKRERSTNPVIVSSESKRTTTLQAEKSRPSSATRVATSRLSCKEDRSVKFRVQEAKSRTHLFSSEPFHHFLLFHNRHPNILRHPNLLLTSLRYFPTMSRQGSCPNPFERRNESENLSQDLRVMSLMDEYDGVEVRVASKRFETFDESGDFW